MAETVGAAQSCPNWRASFAAREAIDEDDLHQNNELDNAAAVLLSGREA